MTTQVISKQENTFHLGQAAIWEANNRYLAMIAGTGGGKTWFGSWWLWREAREHPRGNFLVMAPTYGLLQRVTLPAALNVLKNFIGGEYKAIERTFYLATGGHVYFGSADKPLSLEGVHVHAVWLDEAGQMKREAWDVAVRRAGFYEAPILLTTTPYNLGWLKLEVYDKWASGDKDYFVVQFPSYYNPAYPRSEYLRAKRILPRWKFDMFYRGQFRRPEGLIYQDITQEVHGAKSLKPKADWPVIMAVDWGFNAPSAMLWGAKSPDGDLFIYREYYKTRKTPSDLANDIKELTRDECLVAVVCDPENSAGIEEFKRAGLPAVKADNRVMPGIEAVIKRARERRLLIDLSLKWFWSELEAYAWQVKNDQVLDKPEEGSDHLMDCLRYLVLAAEKYSLAKPALGVIKWDL